MVAFEQPRSGMIEGGLELAYPARAIDPSPQLEHTPFALWIIDALRPHTVVGLGLGDGSIYLAFLQAIQTLGVQADCSGIRLESLPHNYRDDEAFSLLKAYHDALYSRFSALVRSSPSDAPAQVPGNSSVDLLQVNLASDDDVPVGDLEAWLPKMSSRGVILLHPTDAQPNARQFWKNLSSRYPSFEFVHAQGLGLAYVGTNSLPEQLETLLRAHERDAVERVRNYFSRLGTSVSERDALHRAEAEIAALKVKLSGLGAAPARQTENIARVAAQRNVAIRVLRQQTLAAMRPKRDSIAFSRAALWPQIVQHAPARLKRLIPLSMKHQILQLLTPSRADPFDDEGFLGAADINPQIDTQIKWMQPYFASVGLDDEPRVTFLALRSAGYPVYTKLADAERVAQVVRESGLFDREYYLANASDIGDLDPALHYVLVGERMGFAPSSQFDPGYYYERYPDLRRSFECLLVHYVNSGRREGRRATSLAAALTFDRSRIDPQRETVLVIAHEASRTGAPIVAYNIAKQLSEKYNVVTLLLSGGDITSAFTDVSHAVLGPLRRADWHPVEADYLTRHILSAYRLSYAVANSIDTRIMMRPLSCAFVPVVALVHEFASYLPAGDMGRELGWATQTVFSAGRVLDSVRADYPNINNYRVHVLPQGPPELPAATRSEEPEHSRQSLQAAMRPAGYEDAFVVLGCGTIYPRKGVDLFMSTAAAIAKRNPARRIRFVWIGQVLPPELDQDYFPKLLKQIERSGITDKVTILEQVADLEPAYQLADAFFLSSRLDPLPNVAIDSALRGLPVVCFENCSGISDIVATDAMARPSVVPHLNIEAAAGLILTLAADEPMRQQIGAATRRLAEAHFDMARYIARLDDLGREAMKVMQQRRDDFATIEDDETFDTISFLGPDSEIVTREDAIRLFIAKAAMLGTGRQPTANFYYRRPCPGFHPQIYAHENRGRYDIASINPLAHFIREGKPSGPWSHPVITPDTTEPDNTAASRFRIALHVHFHYPELSAEFLDVMASNQTRCDLLLTTNSRRKARMLAQEMEEYERGDVRITIVPNRGRDIGAFLTGLSADTLEQYDFIGHLHSKRSLFLDDRVIGERWRKFIWRNLIGQQHPMMDIILARMATDPRLGMVFPDDPHLSDWDYNLGIAERLAGQIGMQDPLPPFFNFPVGTMFWARSAALAPLFKLKLDWSSYPKEPAPIDGTILHALERMLPFCAQHAGFHYATTHVPGVTW